MLGDSKFLRLYTGCSSVCLFCSTINKCGVAPYLWAGGPKTWNDYLIDQVRLSVTTYYNYFDKQHILLNNNSSYFLDSDSEQKESLRMYGTLMTLFYMMFQLVINWDNGGCHVSWCKNYINLRHIFIEINSLCPENVINRSLSISVRSGMKKCKSWQ